MKKHPLICLHSLLCAGALLARTPSQITVRNGNHEHFARVVGMPARAEWLDCATISVVETDKQGDILQEVPAVLDKNSTPAVLSWLLPDITEPQAVRHFRITPADKPSQAHAETDLTCETRDGVIIVGNTYFRLEHPLRGRGGMPQNIRYQSGYTDAAAHLLDRVYDHRTKQDYRIFSDDAATARVVFQSPLRVVVEAHTAYKSDAGDTPDHLQAVYRYVYTPYSPVVEVTADITRGDGQPVNWSELHFLHLTRQDKYYTHFILGEPTAIVLMQAKGVKSRGLTAADWALMGTGKEAMGVGGGHPVSCWDASGEFVYYVSHGRQPFPADRKHVSRSGRLYFGPAAKDNAWFSRWLDDNAQPVVEDGAIDEADGTAGVPSDEANGTAGVPSSAGEPLPASAQQIDVDNARLVFADASEGFACQALIDKSSGTRFFHARPGHPGLWSLEFRKPGHEEAVTLTSRDAAGGVCEKLPDGLRFKWEKLPVGDEKGVLDVTCDVTWNKREEQFEFRMRLDNRSAAYGLWTSEYPTLAEVFTPGHGDSLLPGGNWGARVIRNSKHGFDGMYPSSVTPMQFMAFNIGGTGVYFAAHDGAARPKRLRVVLRQDLSVQTYAENMGQPGASFSTGFPVVLSLYHGDWWKAAKKYRAWAIRQSWTGKGPIAKRKDFPKNLVDNGFWMCLWGAPSDMETALDDLDRRVAGRVPFGVHWYNWHQIPFDNSYPNYFPAKEGFTETTARLKAKGLLVMPYINGRLWDTDIDSFKTEGIHSAAKNEKCEPYIEIYGSKRRLAPNCPGTPLWQAKIREICSRLMNECGVNGIYLDQIGAASPALCFDPKHGHPLGGGRHWVDGYRAMLTPIKEMAAGKGVALTTENTAESYMDNIDGFLTWVIQEQWDVPALPAVYSGYAVYFASPMSPKDDFAAFRAAQGRSFLWGCQLGWNQNWILDAKHHDHLEYLIRLGTLQKAAKEFMVLGELMGEVPNATRTSTFTTTWNNPYAHDVTLPDVQATLWKKADGDLLLAVVNYSDKRQTFTCKNSPLVRMDGLCEVSRMNEHGEALLGFAAGDIEWTQPLQPFEVCLLTFRAATHDPNKLPAILEREYNTITDKTLKNSVAARLLRLHGAADIKLLDDVQPAVHGEPLVIRYEATCVKPEVQTIVSYPDGRQESIRFSKGETAKNISAVVDCLDENGDIHIDTPELVVSVRGCEGSLRLPIVVAGKPKLEVRLGAVPNVHGGESFALHATVTNHSRYPQSTRLLISMPEGWTAEPSDTFDISRLASRASTDVSLKVTVPAGAATDRNNIDAILLTDSSRTAVPLQKTRPQLVARRFSGNVEDMGSWADSPWASIGAPKMETVRIEHGYGGADDLSGRLRCLWDDDCLYIAAEVRDNIFSPAAASPEVWAGDSVQLVLRNGAMNKLKGYDGKEIEFAMGRSKEGPFVFKWLGGGAGETLKSCKIDVKRDGSLTVYHAAVPWRELGFRKPAYGQRIPFSFTFNDNDGAGFHGWCEWTPGICGTKDSTMFGWLLLE